MRLLARVGSQDLPDRVPRRNWPQAGQGGRNVLGSGIALSALAEALKLIAVHLEDVDGVGQAVEDGAGQALRNSEDLGPFRRRAGSMVLMMIERARRRRRWT